MRTLPKIDELFHQFRTSGRETSDYFACPACQKNRHILKPTACFFKGTSGKIIYKCFRCDLGLVGDNISKYFNFKKVSLSETSKEIEDVPPMLYAEFVKATKTLSPESEAYLKSRNFTKHQITQMSIREVVRGTTLFNRRIFIDGIIIPIVKNKIVYGAYIRSTQSKRIMKISSSKSQHFTMYWNFYKIDRLKPVFIFESIFDAISSGIKNCVSINGINFKFEFFRLCKRVILCFDNYLQDKASLQAIWKHKSKNVGIFDWRGIDYKDFNEWSEHCSSDEIRRTIGQRTIHPNYLSKQTNLSNSRRLNSY